MLEDPYVLINPYIIDAISIDERVELPHKEALEDQVVITQLNTKIL